MYLINISNEYNLYILFTNINSICKVINDLQLQLVLKGLWLGLDPATPAPLRGFQTARSECPGSFCLACNISDSVTEAEPTSAPVSALKGPWQGPGRGAEALGDVTVGRDAAPTASLTFVLTDGLEVGAEPIQSHKAAFSHQNDLKRCANSFPRTGIWTSPQAAPLCSFCPAWGRQAEEQNG